MLAITTLMFADWSIMFHLRDPTNANTLGLRVKFFRKNQEDLPAVRGVGDYVILRKIQVLCDLALLICFVG